MVLLYTSLLNGFCRKSYEKVSQLVAFNRIVCQMSILNAAIDSSKQSGKPIKLPKRIDRSPTDILRALANTVRTDYTAPNYKYHDDPYLIPASNTAKRSYALSKESGRKSARYFLDKYPELFYRDDAEPKIEAFSYRDVFDENTVVDEDDLKKCIIRSEVLNAITVYNNLIANNKVVDNETVHELLELVCFYNCEDPPNDEYLEERWLTNRETRHTKNMWKEHDFAEQLFNSIQDKTSQTYCSLILGMAKYKHAERAYYYFKLMAEKGMQSNVETYNSIISIVSYLRESGETRWQFIEELLKDMNARKIRPNLGTLNVVLQQLAKNSGWRLSKGYAQRVLVEMTKHLGIIPSLATYWNILSIFYKEKGPASSALYEIMDEIENQEFDARDVNDVYFFAHAMEICYYNLSDIQLAYRINECVNRGDNYKFLGYSMKQNSYYQKFFRLLCTAENIDTFMGIYNKYVPNIYTPDVDIMLQIINNIELNEAFHYLPQIWSDIIVFDYVKQPNIADNFFKAMAKMKVEEDLQKRFAIIAWDAIERLSDEFDRKNLRSLTPRYEWNGSTLDSCLNVFLNAGQLEKAYFVIKKLDSDQNQIVGYPESETLVKFCVSAIEDNQYSMALHAIRYANEIEKTEVSTAVNKFAEQYIKDENIKSAFRKFCH